MRVKPVFSWPCALIGLITLGCGNADSADTSPLPPKDTQSRVDGAAKGVDSSDMTPEQKKAAKDYLQQGAANAQELKKSAGSTAN